MAETKEKQGHSLKAEIAGIVFAALFLLTSAALIFYHTGSSNMVGVVGNNVSWLMFATVGYTAYVFPFLFLITAIEFFLRDGLKFRIYIPITLLIFIASSAAMLTLVFGNDTAGGIVGSALNRYFEFYIGGVGLFIVLGAIILISFRVSTGLSPIGLAKRVLPVFLFIGSVSYALCSRVVGKIREKKIEKSGELKENAEKPAEELREKKSQPTIVTTSGHKTKKKKTDEEVQEEFHFIDPKGSFQLPPITLLDAQPGKGDILDKETLFTNSKILEKKLLDFGVTGSVVEVRPGPVITTYEFEPAPGIKVGRITNLSDDLALAMRAISIRILAPVPGKAVVGIEIPNHIRARIILRDILDCPEYQKTSSYLTLAFGKDAGGTPYVADLAKMPHLLVAGSTGAGKSVFINVLILSILYKSTPDDVRFLMIDPKMLELSPYAGIPHLLTPVITDVKRATVMLKSIVNEMERRYRLMSEVGAKNIERYNELMAEKKEPDKTTGHGRLPFIVVVIDELADLMMSSGKEVEESLVRLSQMARASGINIIIATQRPSVDVITGLIKTNFPARVSFQVPSRIDSRTILDSSGAEALLGDGDMLFLPPGTSKIKRIHGAYVSEKEIKKVTEFLKKQAKPVFEEVIDAKAIERIEEEEELGEEFLERYREAIRMSEEMDIISTSYIQRRLRIGYNSAARIIEKMEAAGIVGPAQGSRPREVIKNREP